MADKSGTKLKIGRWQVDPKALTVSDGGQEAKLRLKAMSLLLSLAERPGEVMLRDELIFKVWPETAATDDTLNSTIAQLRKVLTGDEQIPQYIATVPKKGYRLMAPVAPIESHATNASVSPNAPSFIRPSLFATAAILAAFFIWISLFTSSGEAPQPHYRANLVASQPQAEVFPNLSSDGERIVFIRAATDKSQGEVIVKDLKSGKEMTINDHPGIFANPVWSPDDNQIAYIEFAGLHCKVRIVNSGGGPSKEVSPCSPTLLGTARTSLDWLPSGNMLVIPNNTQENNTTALFTVDLISGKVTQFSKPPKGVIGDANQSVSPDGSKIAFTRTSATGTDNLGIIDLVSGKETLFDYKLSVVRGLDWASYNQLILISDVSGRPESWKLNIDSGELSWFGVGGHEIAHLDYDAETKSLLLSELEADHNVFIRSMSGNTSIINHSEFASTQDEKLVKLSNDGRHIAYVRELGNRTEIWISGLQPSSNETHRRLLNLDESYVDHIDWSPDNKSLALAILKKGVVSTFIYHLSNEQFYRLDTPADVSTFSPVWGPESENIFYSVKQSSNWEIWRYAINKGKRYLHTKNGGNKLQLDNKAKQILFSKYSEFGIWAVPIEPQKTEPVQIPNSIDDLFHSWSFVNGTLYFTPMSENISRTIYQYSEQDTKPVVYYRSQNPIRQFDLRGDLLVASKVESCAGDIYLYTPMESP